MVIFEDRTNPIPLQVNPTFSVIGLFLRMHNNCQNNHICTSEKSWIATYAYTHTRGRRRGARENKRYKIQNATWFSSWRFPAWIICSRRAARCLSASSGPPAGWSAAPAGRCRWGPCAEASCTRDTSTGSPRTAPPPAPPPPVACRRPRWPCSRRTRAPRAAAWRGPRKRSAVRGQRSIEWMIGFVCVCTYLSTYMREERVGFGGWG